MLMRRPTILLLAGVLALLPLSPAQAQTTGGLRGQVVDKDGQPLPTARVIITNTSLGVQQATVTDAKGEFRVVPLPPGKGYSVRVEFPEMSTVSIPDIEVPANRIVSVPVTLRPGAEMLEKIRIVATSDVVNPESTTTSTTIGSEFIDQLPILGRNYQDVLTLAPGTSDIDGDGNINIHGSRDTDVVTLVDGVSTVDPVTGQVGQQLNINSIQEIEVKTSGAGAEFSRAQGGFVTIVTKSGGNDFEGSFRFDWRGNTLDGDGAGIDDPTLHGGLGEAGLRDLSFNDIYPQLTVSGPLKKDKAWYFVAMEWRKEETPVNALTQAFVREVDQQRLFGKVSWDLSTNHKLVFTATFDPQTFYNLGLNSFTAVESGFTQELGGRNLVLRETAVFSPSVFLDSTLQDFVSDPSLYGTTEPDTNGNGILFIDRNSNNFIDATETDPGEDFDRDNDYDVYEDFIRKNGALDAGEDLDRDGRLTQSGRAASGVLQSPGGCEGVGREDLDCDGRLDTINEDIGNGVGGPPNGRLDPGEDIDSDGFLDPGTEDRNQNNNLDDRPFLFADDGIADPSGATNTWYPYGQPTPVQRDQGYEQDQRTLRTSGPYLTDNYGDRGRQTLKEDLTVYVPDWHGQHEIKTGVVVEREHYNETNTLRPFVLPNQAPPTANAFIPTTGVILPAENVVGNTAESFTAGIYVQDTFKPRPNLTLNVGIRFDRETTDSFGYTQFDPVAERTLFDRLNGMSGGEIRLEDATAGNNDGVKQTGYCFDPLFAGMSSKPCEQIVDQTTPEGMMLADLSSQLLKAKSSRLTQHHISTAVVAQNLELLYPEGAFDVDPVTGEKSINREFLQTQGAVFQEEEAFRLTNNNLAPRLALAWDPWADSKTKIFASWSRFYDKLFLNAITPEEGPDTISRYYRKDLDGITAGGIPNNGIGDAISKAPPTTTQVDRGLQTPFTDEWSIGFERELAPEVSIRLGFINRNSRDGLQDRDINHAVRYTDTGAYLDSIGRLQLGSGAGAGGTRVADNTPDLYIYNFFFNQIYRLGNYNSSEYKGVEIQVTKRLSRKWQMDASYTYSRAQGDAEDFQSALGDDPATLPYEYGYLNFDQRHVIRFNGTTFLPGDWTLGGVMQWSSGLPYSVTTTKFALDNYDYGQLRTLYGEIKNDTSGGIFIGETRNNRRNDAVLNIDVQASKAFVMGRFNSKLFLAVANLLNQDDLTISTYEPASSNRGGNLQLDAERRFGRRYQIGFQFEF